MAEDQNNQPPTVPPVQPPPQKPPVAPETKAYSELHNKYKTLEAEKVELERKLNAKSNSGKDPGVLAIELEEANQKVGSLSKIKDSVDEMVKEAEKHLSQEQKDLLQYASEDPVKRLAYIHKLRGTQAPKKDSQGNPIAPVTDPNAEIDIASIVSEAAKGNMQPYKEAKKKYGDKVVQKLVADKTKRQAPQLRETSNV